MLISNVSNNQPTFRKLLTGESAKNKLVSVECSKSVQCQFANLKKFFYKNKLSRQKYANIIIEYANGQGFYTRIAPAKNTDYKVSKETVFCNIKNTPECVEKAEKWITYWNNKFKNLSS